MIPVTNASVPKAERLRTAHALAVKEAVEDRYKHEHLDDDERLEGTQGAHPPTQGEDREGGAARYALMRP
jgi:hypothetical protein